MNDERAANAIDRKLGQRVRTRQGIETWQHLVRVAFHDENDGASRVITGVIVHLA